MIKTQKENQITPSSEDLTAARANPMVRNREMKLSNIDERLKIIRDRYGEQHPFVIKLFEERRGTKLERDNQIDDLLRQYQSSRVESYRKAIDSTTQFLVGLQDTLAKAQTRMKDLLDKLKEYEIMDSELTSIQKREEEMRARLSGEQLRRRRPDVDRMVVSQQATDPPELTFPDFAVMSAGMTVLVLGFVAGGVFLKEWLDQRIKSPRDLSLLSSTELLGVVPEVGEDPSGPTQVESIVRKDPTGLMAEAFRQVRTTVTSRMDRRGYKTILLCGIQAHSGVSTVSSNLALSLAFNGRKALVLDANFRRPAQHELFGAPLEPGLIEVLQGTAKYEEVIFHHEEPALDVITTGAASSGPPELLEGAAFRNLLIELEKRYDIIFIDGPPILVASDSLFVAKHVDAMALVVRAMSEKRGTVGRMLREVQNQRTDLLGIILNSVRSSVGGYFRKNYQDFYRYRQTNNRNRRARIEESAPVTGDG